VKLLNPEPSIPVLRSLAVRIGVEQAIVLQQLHFRARLSDNGWVSRSYADWHKHDFPFWSARSVRRYFEKLRDLRIIDGVSGEGREASRWRIVYERVPEVGLPTEPGQSDHTSDPLRENSKRGSSMRVQAPDREHVLLSEWLGHHSQVTGHEVPRAGTKRRESIAASFAARLEEKYSLEDLKLASVGAHADQYRRENGYDTVESILRPTKIGALIDKGRRAAQNGRSTNGESKWD
jgi:hypothetical protein